MSGARATRQWLRRHPHAPDPRMVLLVRPAHTTASYPSAHVETVLCSKGQPRQGSLGGGGARQHRRLVGPAAAALHLALSSRGRACGSWDGAERGWRRGLRGPPADGGSSGQPSGRCVQTGSIQPLCVRLQSRLCFSALQAFCAALLGRPSCQVPAGCHLPPAPGDLRRTWTADPSQRNEAAQREPEAHSSLLVRPSAARFCQLPASQLATNPSNSPPGLNQKVGKGCKFTAVRGPIHVRARDHTSPPLAGCPAPRRACRRPRGRLQCQPAQRHGPAGTPLDQHRSPSPPPPTAVARSRPPLQAAMGMFDHLKLPPGPKDKSLGGIFEWQVGGGAGRTAFTVGWRHPAPRLSRLPAHRPRLLHPPHPPSHSSASRSAAAPSPVRSEQALSSSLCRCSRCVWGVEGACGWWSLTPSNCRHAHVAAQAALPPAQP